MSYQIGLGGRNTLVTKNSKKGGGTSLSSACSHVPALKLERVKRVSKDVDVFSMLEFKKITMYSVRITDTKKKHA